MTKMRDIQNMDMLKNATAWNVNDDDFAERTERLVSQLKKMALNQTVNLVASFERRYGGHRPSMRQISRMNRRGELQQNKHLPVELRDAIPPVQDYYFWMDEARKRIITCIQKNDSDNITKPMLSLICGSFNWRIPQEFEGDVYHSVLVHNALKDDVCGGFVVFTTSRGSPKSYFHFLTNLVGYVKGVQGIFFSRSLNALLDFWIQSIQEYGTENEKRELHEIIQASQTQSDTDVHEENECCICMHNNCDVVNVPCMHCCMCQECYTRLRDKKCPICRRDITTTRPVWYMRLKKEHLYLSTQMPTQTLTGLLAQLQHSLETQLREDGM